MGVDGHLGHSLIVRWGNSLLSPPSLLSSSDSKTGGPLSKARPGKVAHRLWSFPLPGFHGDMSRVLVL